MGNDLLFYESRKRAIDRVKRMQEENMPPPYENFNIKEESSGNFQKFNNEGEKSPFKGESNERNAEPPHFNNFHDGMNNKKGLSDILGSFFKGNSMNLLKGQLGEMTGPLKGIMDYLDLDSEKLIIIMVMWMLFNEKEDKTLLLALGYLLL